MSKNQLILFKLEEDTDNTKYTKLTTDGKVDYIEREGVRFDFYKDHVVRTEFCSKANCPAVTIKYGSFVFNISAIRKINECAFIQILYNQEKKLLIAKPCNENDKNSIQWSRVDKQNKTVPRTIKGREFTAKIFKDMNWNIDSTIKVLGTILSCGVEK